MELEVFIFSLISARFIGMPSAIHSTSLFWDAPLQRIYLKLHRLYQNSLLLFPVGLT